MVARHTSDVKRIWGKLGIVPMEQTMFLGKDGHHNHEEANEGRVYTHNGHTHTISGTQYSDEQIAHTIRMLMRDDWHLEAKVLMARDRILCLIAEKEALKQELENLRNG
tara:strand:- start:169 stop:495 length:327 start_codon:yes stop_codon:yes gene_type:complete